MQARSDEGDSRRAAHTGGGNGNKEAGRARKLWGKGGGGLTVSRLQDDVAKTLVAMVELPWRTPIRTLIPTLQHLH